MSRFVPRATWFQCALAGAVILCLVMAGLMTVSPELHEHLHHDAGHAGHTCLVSTMASGGFETAGIIAPLQITGWLTWMGMVATMRAQWVRPLFLESGVLEHGPPVNA